MAMLARMSLLPCWKPRWRKILAEIWVKVHPDVLEGKKTGYFADLRATQRVRLIAENVSPQSLLRHVSRVYVVTSQYGFEALLAGKPVTCFRPAPVCKLGLN